MAKWVLDTYQGKKTWYSADVVEKIKAYCERQNDDCGKCGLNDTCQENRDFCEGKVFVASDILRIIEREDNEQN